MRYHTLVVAANREFKCAETYDEIRQMLSTGKWMTLEDGVQWMAPLELAVKGEPGFPPLRALIQPHAIAAVVEM